MNEHQLKSLAHGISQADKEAFDALFRALYAPLVRFAYRYTLEKPAACDLVQDAFVKLWETRERIDPDQSIQAYLYRIVRNLALNRQRDRKPELSEPDMEVHTPMETASENLEVENLLNIDKVKRWVSQLPDRQREVIELSRFEGLDHEEIAHVLEISSRTVNNHVVAAMKSLRSRYELHKSETRTFRYG